MPRERSALAIVAELHAALERTDGPEWFDESLRKSGARYLAQLRRAALGVVREAAKGRPASQARLAGAVALGIAPSTFDVYRKPGGCLADGGDG